MASGRFSDNTIVAAMLGLVVLGGVVAFGAQQIISRESRSWEQRAFDRQPAELVVAPKKFVGNDAPGECGQASMVASAIGLDNLEVLWQHELPGVSRFGNVLTVLTVLADGDGNSVGDSDVGHVAVHIDAATDELPPSLMAIDVETGEFLWQRYFEFRWADRFAVSEGILALKVALPVLNPGDPLVETFVAVAADGDVTDWFPDRGDALNSQLDVEPGPGFRFAAIDDQFTTTVDASGRDRATGADGQAVLDVERQDGTLSIYNSADGESIRTNAAPVDEIFNLFDVTASIAATTQVGDDHVLVTIGSHQGPNTRIAVLDRASGELLWSLDNVRAAGLVEGPGGKQLVVYDKRNEEPPDAESTRDLTVVAADDPSEELWSVPLKVNDGGGNGLLGSVDGAVVFAVADSDGDNGELPLQFLIVDGPDDLPDVLVAAEGFGSAAQSHSFHLDEELMAAATDVGVVVQRGDEEPRLIDTDLPVNQVTRIGDVLLVNQWQCGR